MDITSNKKNNCVNNDKNDGCDVNATVYYGLHVPTDIQQLHECDGANNVFHDKTEVLKAVKKYKKARFKAFNYYHEALEFAIHGSEYPNNNTSIDGLYEKPNGESVQVVGEKPCRFRAPKSQDLVKLRKAIEAGDLTYVNSCIWDNPRYLISSGDTPSILQEGFRYNALHVAAKAGNAQMCELVLNTITNVNFIKLLYGDDNNQNAEDRSRILLDLYLNTPDKGLNETPLHSAVKFGAVECVEVLTSYPQCDRNFKNKFNKTPSMIICDRCPASSCKDAKQKIATLLSENYYVPVLRTEDNSMPPVIGEPFSPTSPPNLNSNPISPRLEIHAYAGPMDKEGAEKFRKVWKSTRRSLKFSPTTAREEVTYKDPEKGLERLGKTLASQYRVGWKEYWPFLDSFVDIASTEGLDLLESYLRCLDVFCSGEDKDRSSVSNSELSTMWELCKAFQAWNLNDTTKSFEFKERECNVTRNGNPSKLDLGPYLYLERSCQVFAHRITTDILTLVDTDNTSRTMSILEDQIKHLELLVTSFMTDSRFDEVDFAAVHPRLGSLIGTQILDCEIPNDAMCYVVERIEFLVEKCEKNSDYFSSDDESNSRAQNGDSNSGKGTSSNKQVVCLLENVVRVLREKECDGGKGTSGEDEEECARRKWREVKGCRCVRQNRRSEGSSRASRHWLKARRLSFEFGDDGFVHSGDAIKVNGCEEEDSSDDEWYTPPASPSMIVSSDDEDVFEDTTLPERELFIGGHCPTKTDCAVYNTLRYSQCVLDPTKYPNIYKWFHNVSLYSEEERQSWANPIQEKFKLESPTATSSPVASTPPRTGKTTAASQVAFTPPRSWFRVTQANSPRAVFQTPPMTSRSANL